MDFESLKQRSIYTDLLREFVNNKHEIYAISPIERRTGKKTQIIKEENVTILKLKIGNTQKTNIIEKGISTISIEPLFVKGIKKYFSKIKFDIIMYSTPPITFYKAIEFVKKRDGAQTYLLLKDIFPQNSVDIGMLSKTGIKGVLYKYFRKKEKKLYSISDYIGCMSQANVDYLVDNNRFIDSSKVSICPNCIEVMDMSVGIEAKTCIRNKYCIPNEKIIFVYGGNLGKPQGIDFLIKCLESQKNNDDVFFLIIGDGTEYQILEDYVNKCKPENVKLLQSLPKNDYDTMVGACDVGMIFLDYRFTIPNFPSRLLSYMQAKLPVLAVTDSVSDIGKTIVEGEFGWYCESNDIKKFESTVNKILSEDMSSKDEKSFSFLEQNYTSELCYRTIVNTIRRISDGK